MPKPPTEPPPVTSLTPALLQQAVARGEVTRRAHPSGELFVLNYTAEVQYQQRWHAATRWCRGLIVNPDWEVVGVPFPKFFNWEEYPPEAREQLAQQPLVAFEKLDGSLGISYWHQGEPYLATRGSFTSGPAQLGSRLLQDLLANPRFRRQFDPELTFLFEVLSPAHPVIVRYPRDALVLLAVFDRQGREYPLSEFDCPQARALELDFSELYQQARGVDPQAPVEKEGYVLRFASGLRVKVKYRNYAWLHAALANVSTKTVWAALRQAPDETYQWVRQVEQERAGRHQRILQDVQADLARIKAKLGDAPRKDYAGAIRQSRYPRLTFALLDGRDISDLAWRLVEPMYATPNQEI